jgi:hypothetical protein
MATDDGLERLSVAAARCMLREALGLRRKVLGEERREP